MEILQQVYEELVQNYNKQKTKRQPRIICRIKDKSESEFYRCGYAGGELTLEADSLKAAVYGMHHLTMGVLSGHWAECVGDWQPYFLRPLWVGCPIDIALSPTLSVAVPQFLVQEGGTALFCKRLLEMGYNSVLLGKRDKKNAEGAIDINAFCSACHQFGVKVIIKPAINFPEGSCCPIDSQYVNTVKESISELEKKIPLADFIFWESLCWHPDCLEHPLSRDATQSDLIQADITLWERFSKKKLIYFLPTDTEDNARKQANIFGDICDNANTTIIAFSSVAGRATADHLPPHPIWHSLRKMPHISSTQLMPLVNVGSVEQGEGLWPVLPLDSIEENVSHCQRHQFAGILALVNMLPAKGALLDCSLTVASQLMWKPRPVSHLADTWFAAVRPDLDFPHFNGLLKEIRAIGLQLSRFYALQNEKCVKTPEFNDECRIQSESLIARIRWVQNKFDRNTLSRIKSDRPSFYDYFVPFKVDAQQMIAHILHSFNLSLLHLRKEEEIHEGFWTHKDIRSKLESPQRGIAGSKMAQIYNESRFL